MRQISDSSRRPKKLAAPPILNQGRLHELAALIAKCKIDEATAIARMHAQHVFGGDEDMPVEE